jgi:hypothetical protein
MKIHENPRKPMKTALIARIWLKIAQKVSSFPQIWQVWRPNCAKYVTSFPQIRQVWRPNCAKGVTSFPRIRQVWRPNCAKDVTSFPQIRQVWRPNCAKEDVTSFPQIRQVWRPNCAKDVTSFQQIRQGWRPNCAKDVTKWPKEWVTGGFGSNLRKRGYIFCPNPAGSAQKCAIFADFHSFSLFFTDSS